MTLIEFQAKLEKRVAWRKVEISDAKSAVSLAQGEKPPLASSGLVMLCAHWEGYLREAMQCYIDFVFSQKLPPQKLAVEFIAIAYFQDVMKAAECHYPGSPQHHIKLASRLRSDRTSTHLRPSWEVKTEGNPSTEVYGRLAKSVKISEKLGMGEAEWEATKFLIDNHLLKDRHKIVHGEGLRISKDEFLVRADAMLKIFDKLGDLLMESAQRGTYKMH